MFNPLASQASISLLLLSAISIVLPTAALHLSFSGAKDDAHLSGDELRPDSRSSPSFALSHPLLAASCTLCCTRD